MRGYVGGAKILVHRSVLAPGEYRGYARGMCEGAKPQAASKCWPKRGKRWGSALRGVHGGSAGRKYGGKVRGESGGGMMGE